MEVHERRVADVTVIAVSGDITLREGSAAQLAQNVRAALQQGRERLVLDLGCVRYVDSSGLGELVQANAAAHTRGGSLKLVNLTRRLEDLLALTKLSAVFECFDRESDAIASFGAPVSAPLLGYARRRVAGGNNS